MLPLTEIERRNLRSLLRRSHGLAGWLPVRYQEALIGSLKALTSPHERRILDVGCGQGLLTACYGSFLDLQLVVGVDVATRFAEVAVPLVRYDGRRLPFADGAFDAATVVNVLHHVPRPYRVAFLEECRRVTNCGPLLIKEHVVCGPLDTLRLHMLDIVGNVAYGGMLSATYMSRGDLDDLLGKVGYRRTESRTEDYRAGLMALLFPNRLECFGRFEYSAGLPASDLGSA